MKPKEITNKLRHLLKHTSFSEYYENGVERNIVSVYNEMNTLLDRIERYLTYIETKDKRDNSMLDYTSFLETKISNQTKELGRLLKQKEELRKNLCITKSNLAKYEVIDLNEINKVRKENEWLKKLLNTLLERSGMTINEFAQKIEIERLLKVNQEDNK